MAAVIGALRAVLSLDAAQFTSGLGKVQTKLAGLSMRMEAASARMKKVGAGLTIAAAGFAVAIKGQLDYADQLAETAQKVDVSVEALSKLKYAAEMSGVAFETLTTGLRKLSQNMVAAAGGNEAAIAMFDRLGVAVTNADGTLRAAEMVLYDISEAISKMPDGAEKTAISMALLGKSGAEMIPMLNQGKTALENFAAEAASMGLEISQETADAAGEFNDSLDRITKTLKGLVVQLAAALAPALRDSAEKAAEMTRWFRDLSPETQALAANLALLAVAVGPLIWGLGILLWSLSTIAGALKGLAVLALANPFVLIAVAAIAAAALIYLYWGPIKEWFAEKWQAIKDKAQEMWDGIKQMASDAAIWVIEAWGDIKEKFTSVLVRIQEAFIEGWEAIKAIAAQWVADFLAIGGQIVDGLKQGIMEKWDAMVAWFKTKADDLTANFRSWFGIQSPSTVFAEIGNNIGLGLQEGIEDSMPGVSGALQDLADKFMDTGASISNAMVGAFDRAADAVGNFVKTGKLDVAGFVTDTLAEFAKIGAQRFILGPLAGALGGLTAGLGFANGGAFNHGRLIPFANGGVVSSPTMFQMPGGMGLMGEAGPEAIMPLTRTANGRLGVEMMGGSSAPNVNVTIMTRDAESFRQSRTQIGADIARAVAMGQRGL